MKALGNGLVSGYPTYQAQLFWKSNAKMIGLTLETNVSNHSGPPFFGLIVGCVFIVISLLPMRGKPWVARNNQKLTRIFLAVLGLAILLIWYSKW